MLVWAADVFRVLRGEQPLGAPNAWNSDEFLRQVLPDGLPPVPGGQGGPGWPSTMAPLTRGRHGLIWRRRTVEGTQAAATAKVIAAVAAASAPLEPGRKGKFFIPVDLRRHQPELRSTGWLSQAFDLDVARAPAGRTCTRSC
ncbi:hypothetical protein GXW82_03445 [Streptacidiphilus sp. 4-A2]|nr:hypothetical protein [Streptacidiphilus sp. 4-A2]